MPLLAAPRSRGHGEGNGGASEGLAGGLEGVSAMTLPQRRRLASCAENGFRDPAGDLVETPAGPPSG